MIADVGGTRVYVQTTGSGAMGVRADDGKLLWTYDIEQTTAVIPTPIVRDDLVFFVAGYGRGGALLKQVPGADGEVTIEEVYPLKQELGNKHGGVVLVGDYLYGDSEDRGIPFCAELMTGEVKWKSRGTGHDSASIAAADGHLYVHYADGTMTLVKASPEALRGSRQLQGSRQRRAAELVAPGGPRRQAVRPRRGRDRLLRRAEVDRPPCPTMRIASRPTKQQARGIRGAIPAI